MCTQIITHPDQFIFAQGETLKTTSLKVAEAFNKRHDNIIAKLKSIDCSEEFTALNFKASEYTDPTGRKLPMWEMTKDGFMFLVMGFTGKKAARIKEAYIMAFNQMAEQLKGLALTSPIDPLNDRAIIRAINRRAHALALAAEPELRRRLEAKAREHLRHHPQTDLPALTAWLGEQGALPPQVCEKLTHEAALLPDEQQRALMNQINPLLGIFHPLSSQFNQVLGIVRILRGQQPNTGLTDPAFRKLMSAPNEGWRQ